MREKITDSYRIEKEGMVTLSGKFEGFMGLSREWLKHAFGKTESIEELAKADVRLQGFDDNAKALIREKFAIDYVVNEEGYLIDIDDTITIYADTERAALYAVSNLVDSYLCEELSGKLKKAFVYNYPSAQHRAARVYLPAKKDMPYSGWKSAELWSIKSIQRLILPGHNIASLCRNIIRNPMWQPAVITA